MGGKKSYRQSHGRKSYRQSHGKKSGGRGRGKKSGKKSGGRRPTRSFLRDMQEKGLLGRKKSSRSRRFGSTISGRGTFRGGFKIEHSPSARKDVMIVAGKGRAQIRDEDQPTLKFMHRTGEDGDDVECAKNLYDLFAGLKKTPDPDLKKIYLYSWSAAAFIVMRMIEADPNIYDRKQENSNWDVIRNIYQVNAGETPIGTYLEENKDVRIYLVVPSPYFMYDGDFKSAYDLVFERKGIYSVHSKLDKGYKLKPSDEEMYATKLTMKTEKLKPSEREAISLAASVHEAWDNDKKLIVVGVGDESEELLRAQEDYQNINWPTHGPMQQWISHTIPKPKQRSHQRSHKADENYSVEHPGRHHPGRHLSTKS